MQQQNRSITRPSSLKDCYAEFAEAIIHKLKSYFAQCEVYQNQCLKDYRESLLNFEVLLARLPELFINEIFKANVDELETELKKVKNENVQKLAINDERRVFILIYWLFCLLILKQ